MSLEEKTKNTIKSTLAVCSIFGVIGLMEYSYRYAEKQKEEQIKFNKSIKLIEEDSILVGYEQELKVINGHFYRTPIYMKKSDINNDIDSVYRLKLVPKVLKY